MKRILLTSGGLTTDNMKQLFWKNVDKEPADVKLIFVPSAATESDSAREGISMCVYKFMEMGINPQNIFTYNLKYILSKDYSRTYSSEVSDLPQAYRLLTIDELKTYDAIVFCGGDARLLANELNRTGFSNVLNGAVEKGLFYIGISAGSMIAGGNFADGLRYIENAVTVHCSNGTPSGKMERNEEIRLTDEQAIWIEGDDTYILW